MTQTSDDRQGKQKADLVNGRNIQELLVDAIESYQPTVRMNIDLVAQIDRTERVGDSGLKMFFKDGTQVMLTLTLRHGEAPVQTAGKV